MAKKTRKRARKASKARKATGQRRRPSSNRAGAGRRATAQSRGGRRKTAGAKTLKAKARRKQSARPGKLKKAAGAGKARSARTQRRGGTGREETLAQTPETGRTRQGPTNPMPTKRSTGTPSGAGGLRRAPGLERARRQLREVDETVPSPPSSLNPDRRVASAARTGRQELQESLREHNETSPVLTGGDVDADWEDAYSVGDEAPGGDNPTPDQDRVDDIGKALGVEYQDNEPLKASDKVAERDRHRWELDPASSEDYRDRD
jgi:uncharacterized protein DUF6335